MQPELIDFQRAFVAALDRPARGAMAVYRNTVMHGPIEAMRANFPVVEQIVGAEMFEHVAFDFVSTCPPRTPILAMFGAEFADWLVHQKWIEDLPYLPDVARVERLHLQTLFAADESAAVTRSSGDRASTLTLHPASRLAWMSTPAMSIWLAHQGPTVDEIAPEWKGEGALFARPDSFTIRAAAISAATHRLLTGLRLGEPLSAGLAAAARLDPKADSAGVIASLVNLGVLATPVQKRN